MKLCFLILLYAGITWIISNYSIIIIINDIVKKLEIECNQSKGKGDSPCHQYSRVASSWLSKSWLRLLNTYKVNQQETLRDPQRLYAIALTKIKPISIHLPTHVKPLNNNQLGHYLAGLLDGDGKINKDGSIILIYHDISAAYWLKTQLGFGTVSKNAQGSHLLIISHPKGILKVLKLINGKLRIKTIPCNYTIKVETVPEDLIGDFNNHWLAGFIDSKGIFNLKALNHRITNPEVYEYGLECKLTFQKTQHKILWAPLKQFLGTCIIDDRNNETIIVSFTSAKKIISYLDKYHIISNKWFYYTQWRKAYIILQSSQKYSSSRIGIKSDKIEKLSRSLNKKPVV